MLGSVGVKAIAAVGLSGGSYLSGTLPSCLGLHCPHSLLLSLTLCFGGGVIFATSVLHVAAEARLALPELADIVFCIGFTMLYFIDELIKLYENKDKKQYCQIEAQSLLDRTIHHYGSLCGHNEEERLEEEDTIEQNEGQNISVKVKMSAVNTVKTNRIGLLLAFSVHSVIEGLIIGVQPVPAKVLLLVGAVSSHKLVVAFCLGAELASDGRSFLSLSQSVLLYSLGSTVGIVLGILADQWKDANSSNTIPILQALAAGSLLYIAVSEVLPRERSRWEHQLESPCAGLLQLIFFSFGVVVIFSLVTFT